MLKAVKVSHGILKRCANLVRCFVINKCQLLWTWDDYVCKLLRSGGELNVLMGSVLLEKRDTVKIKEKAIVFCILAYEYI